MTSFEPFDPHDREPIQPRDDFERALGSALNDQANSVPISPYAMTRIQARLMSQAARRPRRSGWLFSPSGAIAMTMVVALVIGGGIYGVIATGPGLTASEKGYLATKRGEKLPPNPMAPTPITVASSQPAPTTPPVESYPTDAIYPSAAVVTASPASFGTPLASARSWLDALDLNLGGTEQSNVNGETATVTYSSLTGTSTVPITTIRLVKWNSSWLVTGAVDGMHQLRATAPAGDGQLVTSPVIVSGAAYGHHETAEVQLFSGTTELGHAMTGTFSSDSGRWAAWLPFSTSTAVAGTLIATERNPKSGLITHLSSESVRLADATTPVTPTSTPASFYGIVSGGIDRFSSTTGAQTATIASGSPNATYSDLQDNENSALYAISSNSTGCNNSVVAIDPSTSAVAPVLAAQSGYSITGFGVSFDNNQFALAEESCDDSGWLLVGNNMSKSEIHLIPSKGSPPTVIGNPTIGLSQLQFIEKTGTQDSIVTLNTYSAKSWNDSVGTGACGSYAADADQANAIANDGIALVVASQGDKDTTQTCGGEGDDSFTFSLPDNAPATSFSIAGGQAPEDKFGTQVIEADSSGKVWIWDGTALHEVATSGTVSSPAW